MLFIIKSLSLSTNILPALNINDSLCGNTYVTKLQEMQCCLIFSSQNKALPKTLHNFKPSSEIVQ